MTAKQIIQTAAIAATKRLPILCLLALSLSATVSANIITTHNGTTLSSGSYVWTYDMALSPDQNAVSGAIPSSFSVSNLNLTYGVFVTVYDFAGYVAGSCVGPTGWTCSAQNTGYTPSDVVPVDNSNISNITWFYTSGATVTGQPNGIDLGLFTARSIYNLGTSHSYTSRGIKNVGALAGTVGDNVGQVTAPDGVPEPSTMAAVGLGLIALVGASRRFKTKRQ